MFGVVAVMDGGGGFMEKQVACVALSNGGRGEFIL